VRSFFNRYMNTDFNKLVRLYESNYENYQNGQPSNGIATLAKFVARFVSEEGWLEEEDEDIKQWVSSLPNTAKTLNDLEDVVYQFSGEEKWANELAEWLMSKVNPTKIAALAYKAAKANNYDKDTTRLLGNARSSKDLKSAAQRIADAEDWGLELLELILPQIQSVLHESNYPKRKKVNESSHNVDAELEKIAKKHCSVETLETRKSDDKDFYDFSVWCLKSALKAAYELGRREQA
jgi:hypothetical protein